MPNAPLSLTRNQLSEFLPNQRAVRAFEQLLKQVSNLLPSDIQAINAALDEARISAYAAENNASQCLSALERIADALEMIALAPSAQDSTEFDDLSPAVNIGTLGQQQHDNARITGGTVTAKLTTNQSIALASSSTLANGAGALVGTLTNAPLAGNPTKWITIDDNGTARQVPAW